MNVTEAFRIEQIRRLRQNREADPPGPRNLVPPDMKRIAAFFKATTIGGLFMLLPFAVVSGVVVKILVGARETAQDLLENLTGKDSTAVHFPMVFAVLIVIAISFGLGLGMISRRGQAAGSWFERTLLFKVPGYAALRAIVGGFSGTNREAGVKPALMTIGDGIECFVLVTEDHQNGRLTVFVPNSPNPASGNVQVVQKNLVRLLDLRISDIGSVLQLWGVGSAKILAKHDASVAASGGRHTSQPGLEAPPE